MRHYVESLPEVQQRMSTASLACVALCIVLRTKSSCCVVDCLGKN